MYIYIHTCKCVHPGWVASYWCQHAIEDFLLKCSCHIVTIFRPTIHSSTCSHRCACGHTGLQPPRAFSHRRPVAGTPLVCLTHSGVCHWPLTRGGCQVPRGRRRPLTLCVQSAGLVRRSRGPSGAGGGPPVRTDQEQPHELCVRWRKSQREVWMNHGKSPVVYR